MSYYDNRSEISTKPKAQRRIDNSILKSIYLYADLHVVAKLMISLSVKNRRRHYNDLKEFETTWIKRGISI